MAFGTYDELMQQVDAGQGVTSCYMQELRDAHGAGKLGVNVVSNISAALDHRGLGHYPKELSVNQWSRARIFKKGTPVGNFISAALDLDEKNDDVLRNIAGNNGDDIIRKIRELVCD